MGVLKQQFETNLKVLSSSKADFFKKNSMFFYQAYTQSSDMCKSVRTEDIIKGGFYHLHYADDSNWMKYSPVFICDWRKMGNMIILMGVNLNFIPIDIRIRLFDKFIVESNIENNAFLEVDFKGMYSELLRLGFEYSIVEYNAIQIKLSHRINLKVLDRFLWAQHPKNKYDPNKLMDIWRKKIETKEKRHQEIISSVLSEFYEIDKEISGKYDVLTEHIKRLQKSYIKYGLN